MNTRLIPLLLGLGACCAPSGTTTQPPPVASATATATPAPSGPPVPVELPGVGLRCVPAVDEPQGSCPVVMPKGFTAQDVVRVATWLHRTRSPKITWYFFDDGARASESMAHKDDGGAAPKGLEAWEARHTVARTTRWRDSPKQPATVRVQWVWQNESARAIPETVIDPEPVAPVTLSARIQPPPAQ